MARLTPTDIINRVGYAWNGTPFACLDRIRNVPDHLEMPKSNDGNQVENMGEKFSRLGTFSIYPTL